MSDATTTAGVEARSTIAPAPPAARPTAPTREVEPRAAEPQPPTRARRSRRGIAVPIALAVVLIVAAAAFLYWRSNLGLVKTDNAQTMGDVAPVASQISGTIVKLDVSDNQLVHTGQVLVELDPTDYNLALGSAQANLAAARAQVNAAQAALAAQQQEYTTGLSVARGALQATTPKLPQAQAQLEMQRQQTAAAVSQAEEQISTARANIASTRAAYETAQKTLARDKSLLAQGAIAQSQVDVDNAAYETAQAAYLSAQDSLRQAQAALVSAQANRQQVAIAEQNIRVNRGEIAQAQGALDQAQAASTLVQQKAQMLAAAQAQAAQAAQAVRTAQVNLDRTKIKSPANGWITNRTAELGQVVQPNQPLMSVTLAHNVWVVANLKETQLGRVQVGNPVRITVDAFRGRVFHGHVQSVGAATGSTVALLPPDNATGNFVKVVQLVPVKITLDPGTDPGRLLQVGLSAEVAIDTRQVNK